LIFVGRTSAAAMHDAVRQDADVRILVGRDLRAASHAAREQGEDRARNFLERRIIVAGGDVHRQTMRGFFCLCQTEPTAMTDSLLDMIAHMRWADTLVADSLIAGKARRSRQPPSEDPVALLAHIAAAEHLWYARIAGVTPIHAVWPDLSPSEARDVARAHADRFTQLVSRSGEPGLTRIVSYRNSAGRDFQNSVRDIVTHVTLHGSYHRGQIARIIRASGGDPPYTDYIQFMRRDQIT